MTQVNHPLPVGTRVYYEDLSGGNGTIVLNDNSQPEFISAVEQFNKDADIDAPASDFDYIIEFDDLKGSIPVQRDGVLRIL